MRRIGVDFGGTKIEAVAMDVHGVILARERVPSPGSYDSSIEAIADLVLRLESATGAADAVGIGLPGSPSPVTGLIRNANSTFLNGQRFGDDVAARLRRPVRVANDANCFTLSEATDGAAAGAHTVFGVILGTGCGGGVMIGGNLLTGAAGVAGEWGHNPLPWPEQDEWPGPTCWCGKRGCLETWLSGPAIRHDHAQHTGEALAPEEIVARAASGDPVTQATLERWVGRLSRALATLINVLDPDVIVIGGGLSNVTQLYQQVPGRLPDWVFSDVVRSEVRRNKHGDSSGVRGAAWLWKPGD